MHTRYDKSRALKENLNIEPPIMSRFDLFFVVVDVDDKQMDEEIANHIVFLHSNGVHALEVKYSPEDIKDYIRYDARVFFLCECACKNQTELFSV